MKDLKIKKSKPRFEKVLINDFIPFEKMQVIDENGKNIGILTKKAALEMAHKRNLDLFCVNDNAEKPIAKFLDYGKYNYEQQKKAKGIKNEKKINIVKEIRMTPTIDSWDLSIKTKKAKNFLLSNQKVKISMRLRGREKQKSNFFRQKFESILEELKPISMALRPLKFVNKCYTIVLSPAKINKDKINHEKTKKNQNENQKSVD